MNDSVQSLAYHRGHQVGQQWRAFLAALAAEGAAQLGAAAFDRLLQGTGERMAAELPLPACNSLGDAEAAINDLLMGLHWGWVRLSEGDRMLVIEHHEYPAGAWMGAVLEGLHTRWLQALGADPSLVARRIGEPAEAGGPIGLRFGHPERVRAQAERVG